MSHWKLFFLVPIIVGFYCSNPYKHLHYADFTPIQTANPVDSGPLPEYRLQIGDELAIKFYYNSELNELVKIRPDGRITLQLIDEIIAAGLTTAELDLEITRRYTEKLRVPEITVIVKEFSSQKIYVGGEVNVPGLIPYHERLTALMAIFQANGFKRSAALKHVIILRNQGTNQPSYKIINLKNDLSGFSEQQDVLLKPFDIVFVPRTAISKINQFIDEYFRQLIPLTTNVGFNYMLWFNK
jgi:protein involved in polysaccharide export with SLBB domain